MTERNAMSGVEFQAAVERGDLERPPSGKPEPSSALTHVLQKSLSVLKEARSHVEATNYAEGMLDGFGPKIERPSDKLLMEIDTVLIELQLLSSPSNAVLPHPVSETKDLEITEPATDDDIPVLQNALTDLSLRKGLSDCHWFITGGDYALLDAPDLMLEITDASGGEVAKDILRILQREGSVLDAIEAGAHPVSENLSSPVGSTATGVSDEEIAREARKIMTVAFGFPLDDDEQAVTTEEIILAAIRKAKSLSEPKELEEEKKAL